MKTLLGLAAIFYLFGCVTIDVTGGKATPAKNIRFKPPILPFVLVPTKASDQLWVSSKTGNSISILSECGSTQDPSLEQLQTDAIGVLQDTEIQSTAVVPFNQREALSSVVSGKVDGVPVKMKVVSFKKNNCNYTLVYGSVNRNFDSEVAFFDRFFDGFYAP